MSAFHTTIPLDEKRVNKAAPSLLMALIWLYSLELSGPEHKRTEDFKQQMILAMRASQLAIEEATGLDAS